ncbi:ABC-type sugar transport system substrate-binding protein [Streptosporangium album]|uniref:ABC-type sugar transport system substrate-binding protein n=1 Tax=Streptosporangium album TaxID=47479 RepID=A0A7W7WCD8_9ACTN|nr:substrate-binding domain-containing protein [Streptosporangium album]MBB4941743.1 ABC-type sugar transport system substrate-binding protein [Streptosporangium album]
MATNSPMSRRGLLLSGSLATAGILAAGCSSEKEPSAAASSGGRAADGPQKGKKVIFVVHDKNPFFAPVQRGFEDFGAIMGWQTQFIGPPAQDVQKTVELQASALSAKPDGVIFTRIDETSFDANIKRATSSGVKVILSNVASDGYEKLGVGFVGQNFVNAGDACGREIAKSAKERTGKSGGVIVCGNFGPGSTALEQRIQGIKQGIEAYNKENGTSFTAEVLITSTDESKAVAAIDAKYASKKGEIVGWAMAAFDHQYVSTWAKSKNLVGKFAVGGFDLIQPVLDGIKDKSIDFSLGQNPYAQGWIAAALLAEEFDPGYPARMYDTGAEVVNAANVDAVAAREARFA